MEMVENVEIGGIFKVAHGSTISCLPSHVKMTLFRMLKSDSWNMSSDLQLISNQPVLLESSQRKIHAYIYICICINCKRGWFKFGAFS